MLLAVTMILAVHVPLQDSPARLTKGIWLKNDQLVIVRDADGCLYGFDIKNGGIRPYKVNATERRFKNCWVSPEGELILQPYATPPFVQKRDLTCRRIASLRDVSSLMMIEDNKAFYSTSPKSPLFFLDMMTGREEKLISQSEKAYSVTARGSIIVLGLESGKVEVLNSASGVRKEFSCHDGPVSAVAVSPDSDLLCTGGEDEKVLVLQTKTGETLRKIEGFSGTVHQLSFSSDGSFIAIGATRGSLVIYAKSKLNAPYYSLPTEYKAVSFSFLDSTRLVVLEPRAILLVDLKSKSIQSRYSIE